MGVWELALLVVWSGIMGTAIFGLGFARGHIASSRFFRRLMTEHQEFVRDLMQEAEREERARFDRLAAACQDEINIVRAQSRLPPISRWYS